MAGERAQIETAVVGGEENRLTVIAALGNVMGYAGEDDAGTAGHNSRVPNGWGDSHENASVTFSVGLAELALHHWLDRRS